MSVKPCGGLKIICFASMDLGKRSDAARMVCKKRYRRKELMDMGLSYENAVIIVNREYSENVC